MKKSMRVDSRERAIIITGTGTKTSYLDRYILSCFQRSKMLLTSIVVFRNLLSYLPHHEVKFKVSIGREFMRLMNSSSPVSLMASKWSEFSW